MKIMRGWTPEIDKVRWPFDPPRKHSGLPMNELGPLKVKVTSIAMGPASCNMTNCNGKCGICKP